MDACLSCYTRVRRDPYAVVFSLNPRFSHVTVTFVMSSRSFKGYGTTSSQNYHVLSAFQG